MTGEPDMLTAALVGSRHSGPAVPATASPVDDLALAGGGVERDTLLRAGAWAVYRRAGYLAPAAPAAPAPATAETRAICPPGASDLLAMLLTLRRDDLMPEALWRLNQAGLRLPPALLPLALTRAGEEWRPALAPALGARGRWLAQFNRAWSWAADTLDDDADLAADAQRIWEEGSQRQRVEVLRWLRENDPGRARDLLAEVWKREKAETRAALLETLRANLAPEDEAQLTLALDDRVPRVRAVATDLLPLLPSSALAQRMWRRAEAAFTYTPSGEGAATLDIRPSKPVDADWRRDGLEDPEGDATQRALALIQPIQRTPPDHWETYFSASPEELIAATAESNRRASIVEAWTTATAQFGSRRWAPALWRFWRNHPPKLLREAVQIIPGVYGALAPLLPTDEVDAFALELLADPEAMSGMNLASALNLTPHPWRASLADAYLSHLRAFVEALAPDDKTSDPWRLTLNVAATALPASHFAQALEPFPKIESKHYVLANFQRELEAFQTTIDLRARLKKEIPL